MGNNFFCFVGLYIVPEAFVINNINLILRPFYPTNTIIQHTSILMQKQPFYRAKQKCYDGVTESCNGLEILSCNIYS